MSDTLIDRIYEAAVIPELWTDVLDDLARIGGGAGALLFAVEGQEVRTATTRSLADMIHDYIKDGWPARSSRAARLFAAQHAGFLGDLDVYTREEIEREPVFTEFLRPRGLGWGVATAIPVPSGDMLVFDVEREFVAGPVDAATVRRLDALRPHLARAALISARLRLERARAVVDSLDALGLPGAMLGPFGRIAATNKGFEELIPDVILDTRRRMKLAQPGANELLAQALESIGQIGDDGGVRSIAVAATGPTPPLVVHLMPLRRAANDVFSHASCLVVATPVQPGKVPTAEVLQALFDLTPAEARVARGIASSQRIEDLAARGGVTRETIRMQLKSVLAKTGTARQAELVALLAGQILPGD
jgi:DNA-binding CsgD family transcriptional regulator